jgi:PAS domain S-box-containing protein
MHLAPTIQPGFRAIFEALPGAYLVLLPDPPAYTIVAVSDAYLTTTRKTRAAVVGRGLFEVFSDPRPADDESAPGPDLRTSFAAVLRTRAPDRMADHRYDLRGPGGEREVRWWAALNTPVLDAQGNVQYILHQAEDVTERASRSRFQQLASVLERVTMATGHDEVLEVVRDGARQLVGADGASLVLREGDECHYVTADSLAGPLWMGQRFPLAECVSGWAMIHGRTAVIEDVRSDPRVPVHLYEPTFIRSLVMVPVGSPEPFATIGTYWSQPRRPGADEVAVLEALARVGGEALARSRAAAGVKVAEAALQESEARYRTLFNSIEAGFCVLEMIFDDAGRPVDYRFLEVNDAFERQTGLTDAIGRTAREIVPDLEQHWFDTYGAVALTGERIRFEQGSEPMGGRWFDVDAFRVGDPGSHRVALLFHEISERKRTEERLREASRLEAVGELAGGVAHEANNQMSVVLGLSEFVLRRDDLPRDVRDDVEQMRRAAERTALVTAQLLAFGRRQLLRPSVLDPNQVITDLAPVLSRTLGVNSRLVLALAPEIGPVRADARQLDQVLLNLTINARDAMPAGGTLTIRTADVELGPAEAHAAAGEPVAPGRYVRLVVEDTGTGIDEAIRQRIFEPFFTTKPVGAGTGLGLASVYGIVKQSGGYIAVDGAPGSGARFVIHLPRADAAADEPEPAAERRKTGAGETVLVVEDEPAVRAMIVRALRDEGYRVLAADDGRAALELLDGEGRRPDVVLTDLVMPRMDGRALAAEMEARFPGVPVIFISGYVAGGAAAQDRAGEPGLLQKPVSPEQLVAVVRERCR